MVITRSGKGKMGKEYFESLTLEQLHAEMRKRDIPRCQDVETCIERLVKYDEEHQISENTASKEDAAVADSVLNKELIRLIQNLTDRMEEIRVKQDNQGRIISRFAETKAEDTGPVTPSVVPNIQYRGANMFTANPVRDNTSGSLHAPTSVSPALSQTFFDQGIPIGLPQGQTAPLSYASVLPTMAPGNAVTLLASQIPNYSGSEEDDVDVWLRRVEHVALIHGVHESVKLLAATNKLTKLARDWYEMDSSAVTVSWSKFKEAMVRRFKRRISFCDIMQKAETRRWNCPKETFQEYVMHKLKLLHPLQLSQRDCINLIIRGIYNPSLRGTAASLEIQTVDELLDRMSNITSAYKGSYDKRSSPQMGRKEKSKEHSAQASKSPSKKDSSPTSNSEITCFHCRAKGHKKTNCPKLKEFKKKNTSSTSTPVASVPTSVAATEETRETTESYDKSGSKDTAEIGCVHENSLRLQISDSVIEVNSVNKKDCSLLALIDTGSPVSFIQESTYKILFGQSSKFEKSKINDFRALNGSHIPVIGSVELNICLSVLPNVSTQSSFQVLNNPNWSTHLVLGRDFLSMNNLTLVYKPSNAQFKECVKLFNEVASADVIEEDFDTPFAEIKTDFGSEVDKQVSQVIQKVNNTETEEVKDLLPVTVNLKDNSVYAYAPRKFAYAERLQIREITDDLLARGVIKESCSPYCARIVPVRKRNGKLRLCVDLRPLNHRVVKQKYPFPIIEDCLSQLADKNVLTLLDLKVFIPFRSTRIIPSFSLSPHPTDSLSSLNFLLVIVKLQLSFKNDYY